MLVVGDEAISRSGLKYLLASEAGLEGRGEGGYKEVTLLVDKIKPDAVVVLAEGGRRPGCVSLIGSVRKVAPHAGILILGRETHHAYLGPVRAAGALGYVLLQATPRELFNAVRSVSRGRRFIDHKIGDELFELFARQAESVLNYQETSDKDLGATLSWQSQRCRATGAFQSAAYRNRRFALPAAGCAAGTENHIHPHPNPGHAPDLCAKVR